MLLSFDYRSSLLSKKIEQKTLIFFRKQEDTCDEKRKLLNTKARKLNKIDIWKFLIEWTDNSFKMAKRLKTVAALGFMKTLLILFNTAFWVRLLF